MEKELEFDVLKLTPQEQEELRKKIVRQMKRYGDTKIVATICECSKRHVQSTWKKYQDYGVNGIKAVKMGRPKGVGYNLTPEQEGKIVKLLTHKEPSQLNLKGVLWDRRLVSELIKSKYCIEMPLTTTGDYLSKWNFTAQRPSKKHYKQCLEEIREWLEIEYPAIVRDAKTEKAEINWLDEVGIQNESNYVKGYALKGKTPKLPVASKHIRVNMISAITNRGKLRFHFYHGKMNQNLFIDFLKKLIKSTNKKIYAIVDNLSVHRGAAVKDWVTENPDKIKIFYLPPYAPELNPDEYLNNNLKHEIAKKGFSETKNEIQSKAMSTMQSFQKNKTRVSDFFKNEKVKYAKK